VTEKKSQLPITLTEAEATKVVYEMLELVQQKLTESPRAWLETTLRDYLQRGLIETLRVVEAANDGDEIADAALRRVFAEMLDRGEEPPATLKAYGIRGAVRGPVTRKRGNAWYDNWRRDIGIAVLVFLTMQHFGLRPTRNREQRRRRQPSASSVVHAALGRGQINVAEKTVENIWARLQGHIGAFIAAGKP
jgi:hypothetical protein